MQRCRSFSERVGPQVILLESQPGKQSSRSKRSREITTEPIAVWVQSTKTLANNRQSITVCGYCGYYLEHCSKTNHIAIKGAKCENVFGLVDNFKKMRLVSWTAQNMSISNVVKRRLSVTWTKYLTSKFVGFLVRCWKKITCEFGGTLCGRIKPSIVRVIVRDYCRTNVLAKSSGKSTLTIVWPVISLAVQIYLAALAIANSFRKLCLTAKENHVAWHELDEHETKINSKTECRIFPYKWVLFKSRR